MKKQNKELFDESEIRNNDLFYKLTSTIIETVCGIREKFSEDEIKYYEQKHKCTFNELLVTIIRLTFAKDQKDMMNREDIERLEKIIKSSTHILYNDNMYKNTWNHIKKGYSKKIAKEKTFDKFHLWDFCSFEGYGKQFDKYLKKNRN
jgi:hypothetical protein